MAEKIVNRLVSIKSIVTLALTAVFSYLSVTHVISGEQFLTIFTVIISFYFGTQHQKNVDVNASGGANGNG